MKTAISPVTLLAMAIFAALGLAASIAFAQDGPAREQGQSGSSQQQGQSSLQSMAYSNPEELKGAKVMDGQENDIGEVQEVVVSRRDGQFYVVISSDEFLGLGDEDLAVAVNNMRGSGDQLVVNTQEAMQPYLKDEFLLLQEP